MLETVVHAIGDGAVVVEAGEDFLHLDHHIVLAGDVEEGFLLTGKARVRKILGGGRRSHRYRHLTAAVLVAQLAIGTADVAVQFPLQGRTDHPVADLLAGLGQRSHILDIQRREAVENTLVKVVVRNEVLEGLRRRRVTARYRNTEIRQVADHFAK